MTPEQIAEAALYYEEYNFALDPKAPGVQQAKLLLDKICRDAYANEPEPYRAKVSLPAYVAGVFVPAILRYLEQRTSRFPTIQPERRE